MGKYSIKKAIVFILLIVATTVSLTACIVADSMFYEVTYEWSYNYRSCTATKRNVFSNQIIDEETAISNTEIIREGSCETNEITKFVATFDNESFKKQTIQEQTKLATGHFYGEEKVDKTATCTVSGLKSSSCVVCGKTNATQIPALGHTYTYEKDEEKNEHIANCQDCNESLTEKCTDSVERDKICDFCNGQIYTSTKTVVIDFSTGPDSIENSQTRYYQDICVYVFKDGITASVPKYNNNGYLYFGGNTGITLTAPEGAFFTNISVDKSKDWPSGTLVGGVVGGLFNSSDNFTSVSTGKYSGTTWTGNSDKVTFNLGTGSLQLYSLTLQMEYELP